jgi:flagellar biosynthesis/type III secretory pathway protein FliH
MQLPRILKAREARDLGSQVVFNYEDIRKKCDDNIEHAQRQAHEILDRAQREAEEIRRQAHSQGLAAGRATAVTDIDAEIQRRATELGEKFSSEKLKTTLPAMIAAVNALDRERDRWLADWEAFGLRLSVAIAHKILRRELQSHPEVATGMLAETLRLAAGNTSISLRLHPDDVQLLGEYPEEVARSMASSAQATIVPDPSVSRGGCVIDSQHGVIDARIETQLERIVDELMPPAAQPSTGKTSSNS